MKILKNIEDYFSFIDVNKRKLIDKHRKIDFISASKIFVFNGSKNILEEIFTNRRSNDTIMLENFISIGNINQLIKEIETLKEKLINEINNVKNNVDIIILNLDKTHKVILNNIRYNLLIEIENKEFDTSRIMNEDDVDYVYIFSRLNKEEKEQLRSVIENFYEKLDPMVSNFKNDTK